MSRAWHQLSRSEEDRVRYSVRQALELLGALTAAYRVAAAHAQTMSESESESGTGTGTGTRSGEDPPLHDEDLAAGWGR